MLGLVAVLFFLGIGLFFTGMVMVLSNLNNLARRKRILATPTSPVRQAMGGLVEIKGHIAPSEKGHLVAPFSGREVVWVRFTLEGFTGTSSSKKVVLSEVYCRPFFVDDDSGEVARILPQGANVVVDKAVVSSSFRQQPPPPHIEDFMRASGLSSTDFFGVRKTMSYIEELLAPGDALYAVGPSRRDPGRPVSDGTGVAPSSQLVMYADPGAHGELILTNKSEEQLVSRLLRPFVLGLICTGVGALAFLAFLAAYLVP
jgi:E3 Ubiquitin ligase